MIRTVFFLLLFPILAFSHFKEFLSNDEDPTLFHHVNVISGHLTLSFHDALIAGANPIPILRTYTSSGALERSSQNFDLIMQVIRGGWTVQGEWSLFPHTSLIIEPSPNRKIFKAYISEPNGNVLAYAYSHKSEESKHTIFLKPINTMSQSSGKLSYRTNPQNNLLQLDLEAGVAIVFLPNGGSRTYRGTKLHHYKDDGLGKVCYLLDVERLPGGHLRRYFHDQKRLRRIESTNPAGTTIYAAIEINDQSSQIQFKASDGQQLSYPMIRHENRKYINEMQSSTRPHERYHFIPGRKGIGVRLASINVGGKEPFKVQYYLPATKEQERKWVKKPEQKEFQIDKVEKILAPVGPQGEDIAIAQFTYSPGRTDVRDAEGLLIRYHYDADRLNVIEYFDERDQLHSLQRFYWEGTQLCTKAMFDRKQRPLFAKTFAYEGGNVVEEIWWGHLTGNDTAPLSIDEQGRPSGAESYRKTYTYHPDRFHLLKTESEEEGPTYEYFYQQDTDLCTTKLTKAPTGRILVREFSFYDDANLLIREICDDGSSLDPEDTSRVTECLQKQYERNFHTGLPEWMIESYLDPPSNTEKLLKKTKYTYLNQKIHTEEIFDATGASRYTLITDYDDCGRVRRKTTPLGRETKYRYNSQGHLEESKEVGSHLKIFRYNTANRLISCEEPDTGKITTTYHDAKGRILFQTDFRGNETVHTYDGFGNRRTTEFPTCKDEQGQIYAPIPTFECDLQGNLIVAKMPGGEKTETVYNLFRQPTIVVQADGTQIRHVYNKIWHVT